MSKLTFGDPSFIPIFDQIKTIVDYTSLGVFYLEGTEVSLVGYRGPLPLSELQRINFDISDSTLSSFLIEHRKPLLISDLYADDPFVDAVRKHLDAPPEKPFAYYRSWMGFPLEVDGQLFGFLDIVHDERNFFKNIDFTSVKKYLKRVVNKIEFGIVSTLYKRRSMEVEELFAIEQGMFSHLDISQVLQLVTEKAYQLTSARQIDIFLAEEALLANASSESPIPANVHSLSQPNPFQPLINEVISTGQSIRILDTQIDQTYHLDESLIKEAHSFLIVPIKTSGQSSGVLIARDKVIGLYSPAEVRALTMLTIQASIALDHVKLYHQEQDILQVSGELMRLQEQKQIAQALHDTVAQTLFRIGIEAKWCDQNLVLDKEGKERIRTIQRLLACANEELRNAIFALNDREIGSKNNLVDILQDLVIDFQKEYGIETTLVISPNFRPLRSQIAEVIYRIVREALTNVRKYANAKEVLVSLYSDRDAVTITIQDDGSGMSTSTSIESGVDRSHFGIAIMRQLVAALHGEFYIGNNDDQGVMVKVSIPNQYEEK
jgi:signal transduction histidine kinase